jgi:hypothetical protein
VGEWGLSDAGYHGMSTRGGARPAVLKQGEAKACRSVWALVPMRPDTVENGASLLRYAGPFAPSMRNIITIPKHCISWRHEALRKGPPGKVTVLRRHHYCSVNYLTPTGSWHAGHFTQTSRPSFPDGPMNKALLQGGNTVLD